jgi:hypothetical protein
VGQAAACDRLPSAWWTNDGSWFVSRKGANGLVFETPQPLQSKWFKPQEWVRFERFVF